MKPRHLDVPEDPSFLTQQLRKCLRSSDPEVREAAERTVRILKANNCWEDKEDENS